MGLVSVFLSGLLTAAWLSVIPTDAAAWESHSREKKPQISDGAIAVAVDPAGDVIAFGSMVGRANPGWNFGTVKLSGATGREIWRSVVAPSIVDEPLAFAMDPGGNPIIGGWARSRVIGNGAFAVFKISGTDGDTLWSREILGGGTSTESPLVNRVEALEVDLTGDVIAAGALQHVPDQTTFAVLKLSGVDGSEIWRFELDGSEPNVPGPFGDEAFGVAADGSGDVYVAGRLVNLSSSCDAVVVKLAGDDGSEVWRREFDGASACDSAGFLAIEDGAVVLSGTLELAGSQEQTIWKLSAADGATLWQADLGPGISAPVELLSSGDVAAAGALLSGADGSEVWRVSYFREAAETPEGDLAVVVGGGAAKLSVADGSTIWTHRKVKGAYSAIAAHPDGDVLAAGIIPPDLGTNPPSPGPLGRRAGVFAAVRIRGTDGADIRPISGERLLVQDKPLDASGSRLIVVSGDGAAIWPDAGGMDDPTIHGATLEVRNPGTGETAMLDLPAPSWEVVGAGGSSFRYREAGFGPCKAAIIRAGRLLKIRCKGAGIPITLDEPSQGALALQLTIGATRYCMLFGGEIRSDTQASPRTVGRFVARGADAPTSCLFPP
jgi:outer membrane protein assembly factor BamB